MPRRRGIPAYQLHRGTGQARVTIDGKDHYLGPHGSPESKQAYDDLIRKLLTDREKADLQRRVQVSTSLTINELAAAYRKHAETYYVKRGKPTNEVGNLCTAIKPVREQFGFELVTSFGPRSLKAIRAQWVAAQITRTQINKRVERVRRMFSWGVSEELVPPDVLIALRTVQGLRRGRTEAKEGEKVKPVLEAHVYAIKPYVNRQICAMIELQLLTGMRPGEVTIMRTLDVSTTGKTWEYAPFAHKTEHHDHQRTVFLGPQAQEVLKPWLRTDLEAFLFSPLDAMDEIAAARRAARVTPLTPSQRARTRVKNPSKAPGQNYSVTSYNRAIREGIRKANEARKEKGLDPIPHWSAHQLRHSAATRIRRECGLDVTRTVLGHRSPAVTAIYAERDSDSARMAMEKLG